MGRWSPGMPLPDWRGDDAMRDWVFHQLDNYYRDQVTNAERILDALLNLPDHDPKKIEEYLSDMDAENNLYELLDNIDNRKRRSFLLVMLSAGPLGYLAYDVIDRIEWKREFVDRLQGKRKRGRRPKPQQVRMARQAVKIIQNLWREHYAGKWQRWGTAHKLAAEYFGVDEKAVRARPSGPPGKNKFGKKN